VSRHVAAGRWAAYARGTLAPRAIADADAHAADCARCRAARDRVVGGVRAMRAIATQADPSLPWESVRARIHWERSTAERSGVMTRPAPTRRRWRLPVIALGGAAAVAAGVGLWLRAGDDGATPAATLVAAAPAATPLRALLTQARGEAHVDAATGFAAFDADVVAGSVLRTGDGALAVQFGEASAFALGPRSELTVARLDDQLIELEVDGVVDVLVAPRRPGQRFVVRAGGRAVEVRGTQFRVEQRGDGLDVRCSHGAVEVRDDNGAVTVRRGEAANLAPAAAVVPTAVRSLSDEEQRALAAATPYTLPAWSPPEALRGLSAPVALAGGAVRVDGGAALEAGAVTVRLMSGRHLIEGAVGDDAAPRSQWIDVGAAPTTVVLAAGAGSGSDAAASPASVAAARPSLRPRRDALTGKLAELRGCTAALRRQGVDGTFAELELSVDAAGRVTAANIDRTDLPTTAAACVRQKLRGLAFGAGPAGTWRQRVEL
jgi:hypothetical protein